MSSSGMEASSGILGFGQGATPFECFTMPLAPESLDPSLLSVPSTPGTNHILKHCYPTFEL